MAILENANKALPSTVIDNIYDPQNGKDLRELLEESGGGNVDDVKVSTDGSTYSSIVTNKEANLDLHLYGQTLSTNSSNQVTLVGPNGSVLSTVTVPYATKAGSLSNTSAIGGDTQPVYFNASGSPVACTSYANASVASASQLTTGTTGGTTTPVYFSNGVPTVCTSYANASVASATKATGDESGNNIKASYGASLATSGNYIQLKNKNGGALSAITAPYATSAGSASQLSTGTTGGTTTPVYFSNGVPTSCGKSLVSNLTATLLWSGATTSGSFAVSGYDAFLFVARVGSTNKSRCWAFIPKTYFASASSSTADTGFQLADESSYCCWSAWISSSTGYFGLLARTSSTQIMQLVYGLKLA